MATLDELFEALVLFGLLRELDERGLAEEERLLADDERLLAAEERVLAAVPRLFVPEALRLFVPEPPLFFGLDPFELLEAGFRLLVELAWAMSPSLVDAPAVLNLHTPLGTAETPWVQACWNGNEDGNPTTEDQMAFEDEEKRADEETLPDTSLHAYGEGREEDVEGDQDKLQSSDPETSQREEISEGDDAPQMPEPPKE